MVGLSMDQVFVTGAVEVKRILDFELKADINEHAVLILDVIVDRVSDESCWNLIGKKSNSSM
uniref:hypothetical protein n=1 Tax=Clostridium sp. NkU-1 TaxID=1095009 RepID=UPI003260637C